MLTDWLMVIITTIYVIATIIICVSNHRAAKAAREAVEESKNQFKKNVELQTKHNYDSVRPCVSIDFSSSDRGDSFAGSIVIKNHGLGPAIIKGLYLKKNNRQYLNTNGFCTLLDMICLRDAEEKTGLPVNEIFVRCYTKEFRDDNQNMDYLAAGEQLLLLGFETRNKQESECVGKIFHGVQMELKYTDIYTSSVWQTSCRLSYFKPKWRER